MTENRYKDYWVSFYQREEMPLRGILQQFDPFAHWEANRSPDGTADDYLRDALRVLYSDRNQAMAREFLTISLSIIDRATSEQRLDTEACKGSRPMNYGRLLRTRVYAQGLLGAQWDPKGAFEASRHYLAWCKAVKKSSWDSQDQAYYLMAVRLSLLADNAGEAGRLLKTVTKLKWHQKEVDLLKAICRPGSATDASRDTERASFKAFLDEVRDPVYEPGVFIEGVLYPFEVAMVYDMYYENEERAPRPLRAVELVSC